VFLIAIAGRPLALFFAYSSWQRFYCDCLTGKTRLVFFRVFLLASLLLCNHLTRLLCFLSSTCFNSVSCRRKCSLPSIGNSFTVTEQFLYLRCDLENHEPGLKWSLSRHNARLISSPQLIQQIRCGSRTRTRFSAIRSVIHATNVDFQSAGNDQSRSPSKHMRWLTKMYRKNGRSLVGTDHRILGRANWFLSIHDSPPELTALQSTRVGQPRDKKLGAQIPFNNNRRVLLQ